MPENHDLDAIVNQRLYEELERLSIERKMVVVADVVRPNQEKKIWYSKQ